MRQFSRLVVGDVTNASGNEALLRQKGVQVDILEDPEGVAFYAKYRLEKPDQDLEDWEGRRRGAKGCSRQTQIETIVE